MGRSKRASASHGGAQGAAASAPSMATGTQFSTAGHIDTGKRRASRNGAVVFWMVWSAKSAAVEVEDYASAVSWIAQTAMRKAIGRATVAEVATRRDQLDEELKEAIEEKLNPWGITIIDVEIRDIVLPKELQEAMAQEAVAERKKNARMVLAEAENAISKMLREASEGYAGETDAMTLRTGHLA